MHLREDRRHIQDRDLLLLRQTVQTRLNLEMAATDEMIGIALEVRPDYVTLVPEKRQELTTEGGLDVLAQEGNLKAAVRKLADAGIVVSVFIDAELGQVEAAKRIGAAVCEVHTGPYAHAFHAKGRVAQGIHLTIERTRPEIEVNGSRLRLTPREQLLLLFLANRMKNGEPAFPVQKDAMEPLNEFRKTLLKEAPASNWSDWRYADTLKSSLDDQDIRRALSSLRGKILGLGTDAAEALESCLPERGSFSLDVPAPLIYLKP